MVVKPTGSQSWFPGDPWTLESLYDNQDAARRAKRDAEKKGASEEWRTTEWGNYNKSIYIGLDLGKKADHTALITLEPLLPHDPEEQQGKYVYHLSRIESLPLEVPYPKIARLLRKVYKQLDKSPNYNYIYIVVDEGGVGTAVTDQVVELIPGADIYRVTLTGGIRPNWSDARNVSLPKPQMASTLIALMEARRLWVADGMKTQLEELKEELLNYERKITDAGHDQYGAMKTGKHDDIASAIGLAAWIAEDMGGGSTPVMW
jgi:hypothetical protein